MVERDRLTEWQKKIERQTETNRDISAGIWRWNNVEMQLKLGRDVVLN